MKCGFLFISIIFCFTCHAQQRVVFSIQPDWLDNNPQVIRSQNFKSDSAYYYKRRNNNKDSTLIMTEYFDSLGDVIERDEYNFKGKVFRITNYTYVDTVLLKKETVSKDGFNNNGSSLTKRITTYDHDSVGNIIIEKEYSFLGDLLKPSSVTIWNRDYDTSGHLIREFITPPKGTIYLYHTYFYTKGNLSKVKTFDVTKSWIYSYLYEYNEDAHMKSVYLDNKSEKSLEHESFYDNQKKLIIEKDYSDIRTLLDHATQAYFYTSEGLIENQSFQDVKGENYYYKHFYSK